MDNLTHSLTGALLGQMGLKRMTGLAMPTLIIAANIPDIDAIASVLGTESLAIRRGITHGPIALLLLPLALTGLMLLWDRWRPNPNRLPVRAGPLLLLAYLATLTHPALDWLNSYGIRLLEPFSSRWSYGDTLFIIDLWLWLALIVGFVWSRRREKRGAARWQAPATAAFAAILLYIAANGLITSRAEALATRELDSLHLAPELVVANPLPLTFWNRRILWRNPSAYGSGAFSLGQGLDLSSPTGAIGMDHPALAAASHRDDVRAFLFWSRMPIIVEEGGKAYLTDQRFAGRSFPIGDEEGTSFRYDPFTVPLDPEQPR